MHFVVVVRDFKFFDEFFKDNQNVKQYSLHPIDNREANYGIPKNYNSFLDEYDYSVESWLIFCHEDFLIQDKDLADKLNNLDKKNIYGPIGSKLFHNQFEIDFNNKKHQFPLKRLYGNIVQRNKDATNAKSIGDTIDTPFEVDTLDCCCLIIHSSLIQNQNLRFDENLDFDLYVEDFCINAKEKFHIKSFAIQLHCEHWSSGNISQRYYKSMRYLDNKYPNSLYAGSCSFIGGKSTELNKRACDMIPYLKISKVIGASFWINSIAQIYASMDGAIKNMINNILYKK